MKCVICHGEDVGREPVREEMAADDDIVFVPIEALVCHACGERYYDRRTVRYLEKVADEVKQGRGNLTQVGKLLQYG